MDLTPAPLAEPVPTVDDDDAAETGTEGVTEAPFIEPDGENAVQDQPEPDELDADETDDVSRVGPGRR